MEATQYEIHMTREYVIVSKGTRSLWCSRRDGSLKPGSGATAITTVFVFINSI